MIVYKCPCCGADIQFNSDLDKMKCAYCDNEFEVSTLKDYENGLNQQKPDDFKWKDYGKDSGNGDWQDGEQSSLKAFRCSNCGGEIVGDKSTMATTCPFCDNPVVMSESVEGMLRPDYVIPFKKSSDDVYTAYKNFISHKFLLPKAFKKLNVVDCLKGIYVPFWLFDCSSNGDAQFKATKIHKWSDSNYHYTRTDYFSVVRSGTMAFEKVPVDGSQKMDDTYMESIEPFDYKDAVDFQTAYLAGYFANRYDVDVEHSIDRANSRIRTSTTETLKSTVQGYATVVPEQVNIQLQEGDIHYALMPVWMLTTKYKNEKYTFAMNGQTGKFVGKLPINYLKLVLTSVGTFIGSFAVAAVVITAIM